MGSVRAYRRGEELLTIDTWRAAKGDETYALDWPLTPESVVLEVGGYEGRWARQIAERYNPRLYVFEPQQWAYDRCLQALKPFPSARVFNFGLGVESGEFPMGEFETDGCSFLKTLAQYDPNRRKVGMGTLREAGSVLDELGLHQIDLCLVNIEGYEFILLPYLIEQGLLNRVKRLMLQAHLFVENGAARYAALRAAIEQTHRVVWDFGATLAAWEQIA